MKKAIILIFALLITAPSFAQNILNLFGRSQDFFKLMSDEKFTEAYAFFDDNFQAKVSEDNIKQLWGQLEGKLGKLDAVDVITSKTEGNYFTVLVEGVFANDTQRFLLAFDKSEKIVGFFLQPKPTEAAYIVPKYADTTLYKETEINVKTPGHSLVGMLTTPRNQTNYPVVILVHGSGPADMDATVGANKIFKDLAVGLAAKGIATIRYVKRTMLYPNDFTGAFTVKEEVIDDALAAIELAKSTAAVNKKQIYLLGHSLGGMLAPRIGGSVPDLNGIILLAAPARKFADLMVEQNKYMFERSKDTTEAGKKQLDTIVTKLQVAKIAKLEPNMKPDSVLLGLPAAYWIDLNVNDQVAAAKKLTKRIFIAQGGYDFQVSTADYNLWNNALGKKKNATLKLYPNLNHLFTPQTEKGTLQQYQSPANVDESLINDIASWIKSK